MKSREIASILIAYWQQNSGIGHTRTILDGAGKTKATVVVATAGEKAKGYRNLRPDRVVTLEDVAAGALNARQGFPLVLDNEAVVVLLKDLLKAATVKKEKKA